MDNKMIVDLVVIAILAAAMIIGAVRGLFKSLMTLLIVVIAVFGAARISAFAAEPVTAFIFPSVQEQAEQSFQKKMDALHEKQTPSVSEGSFPIGTILDGTTEKLRAQTSLWLADTAYSLVRGIVQTVLFVVCYLLLRLILHFAAKAIDKVLDLPVLRTFNGLGGALFGLTVGALALFLAVFLVRRFGSTALDDLGEGTTVLAFFLDYTPYRLIASVF